MIYKRIVDYCQRNGMSIAAFERMCNIGNGAVSKWQHRDPSLTSLSKISKVTGLPLSYWIDGDIYGD